MALLVQNAVVQHMVADGVVGDVVAERLGDAPKTLARTGTTSLPMSFDFFLETASMSSPIRPIGHSDCTEMPLLSGNRPSISSMILASFLSPPKTMSFSWKSEVKFIVTNVFTPVVPM